MNEMIERVARKLYEAGTEQGVKVAPPWEDGREWVKRLFRERAREIIAAMREPTQAMVDAGQRTECEHGEGNCGCAVSWSAMIAAALEL